MSITLSVTLGTVNYTDYLHVIASKVSNPSVPVFQTWIDVPVSNYNFPITGLDADMYYVRYYDAPTNVALGTLVAELVVNALTADVLYERRFYTVGGPGMYDPAVGDAAITDPYLIDKTIQGVMPEAFRYLDPESEFTFDNPIGEIAIAGAEFDEGEKIIIELKYAGGITSSSQIGGLYDNTITITESSRTLVNSEINSRLRCKAGNSFQAITLCSLASIAVDGGFYFDHGVGGLQKQVKILTADGDIIRYNGMVSPSDDFTEFWVGVGEHVLLRKFHDDGLDMDWWEVITDYKGQAVGERLAPSYRYHPSTLLENGALIDGDMYPRLWWWIKNVISIQERYVTDTVINIDFVHTANKRGQFAIHSTLKKFRMPNTVGLMDKGLANFDAFGGDTANRPVDAPGGIQGEMVKAVDILLFVDNSTLSGGVPYALNRNDGISITGAKRGGILRSTTGAGQKLASMGNGVQNRVDNNGICFSRRC